MLPDEIENFHLHSRASKFKPVSNHLHSEWEKGRRNLATGSINALQTTPINEMLSFHLSRFCLSQSQGSRREREFCSLNLEFRDENEIFLINISGFKTRPRYFFKVSCFEMGTRFKNYFLTREKMNLLILTRIPWIKNSRHAL